MGLKCSELKENAQVVFKIYSDIYYRIINLLITLTINLFF